MYVFEAEDANAAWIEALSTTVLRGRRVPSRVADTLELSPATLEVRNPRKRLVTAYGRPTNPAFALAEVLWILDGRDDVATLLHYNSTISNYSDDGVRFNAAYGHRIRRAFGYDQLLDMIMGLKADPGSRQAVLNIWYPECDRATEHLDGGGVIKHETKDRACNLIGHALIRDRKMNWFQKMRSNDIMWGTPNNFMQWMHIMEYVANSVGVELGTYFHEADSLHLYDYHADEARDQVRHYDLYGALRQNNGHAAMWVGAPVIHTMLAFEEQARNGAVVPSPEAATVGSYWRSVADIFRAWAAYKEKEDQTAFDILRECDDRVLAAAQVRYFYWFRWHTFDWDGAWQQHLETAFPPAVSRWITAGHKS